MEEDTRSLADLAREAILIQDASNLTGVVHGFSRSMTRLRQLFPNEGTEFFNTHPIAVMFTSKLSSLSNEHMKFHFNSLLNWIWHDMH